MMTRMNTTSMINLLNRRAERIRSAKLLIKSSQQRQSWPNWTNSTVLHNRLSSSLISLVYPLRRTPKTATPPSSYSLNEKTTTKTPQALSLRRSPLKAGINIRENFHRRAFLMGTASWMGRDISTVDHSLMESSMALALCLTSDTFLLPSITDASTFPKAIGPVSKASSRKGARQALGLSFSRRGKSSQGA